MSTTNIHLQFINNALFAITESEKNPTPVKILLLRPISDRSGPVSIHDTNSNKEIAVLSSLEQLDEQSRTLAVADINQRYRIPQISKVHSCTVTRGNRYWDVNTDKGRTRFLINDPAKHITWLNEQHLIIRDVSGCHYEISNVNDLDELSHAEMAIII